MQGDSDPGRDDFMGEKINSKCFELILNYNCNARCAFCSQRSFDKSRNAGLRDISCSIRAAHKSGYRRLGFTGGEPLIRPDILKIVSTGRSAGFRFIRVQTNGIRLADPQFCSALAGSGLTFCKFSFASDQEAVHDTLTGAPGAWRKALAGVRHMRKLKVRVGANILVNRLNYRRLPRIIDFFLESGITSFVIIYPIYIGGMAAAASKLGVSLSAAAGYFAGAAETMEKAGLGGEMLFLNVPPCFLGGREHLAIGMDLFNTVVTDPSGGSTDLDRVSAAAKVRSPACARCALKTRCGGVDYNYARVWGFEGFRAASSAKPVRPAATAGSKGFLSDNERCIIEILKMKKEASTSEILRLSRKIVLCRDCSDGNVVMDSARKLAEKGRVESRFSGGRFYWRLR